MYAIQLFKADINVSRDPSSDDRFMLIVKQKGVLVTLTVRRHSNWVGEKLKPLKIQEDPQMRDPSSCDGHT